jgi:hypothetical protein
VESKLYGVPAAAVGLAAVSSEVWAAVIGVVALCFIVGYVLAVQSHRISGNYPWHMPPVFWAFVSGLLPVVGFVIESVACFTTASQADTPTLRFNPPEQPSWQQASSERDAVGSNGEESAPPTQPQPQAWPPPVAPAGPEVTWPQGNWPAASSTPPPPPPSAAPPGVPAPPPPGPTPAYEGGQWPAPMGPDAFPQSVSGPGGWQAPYEAAVPANEPPPLFGWYPDPTGRHQQRYWDGRQWSHRVADNGVKADDPEGAV